MPQIKLVNQNAKLKSSEKNLEKLICENKMLEKRVFIFPEICWNFTVLVAWYYRHCCLVFLHRNKTKAMSLKRHGRA